MYLITIWTGYGFFSEMVFLMFYKMAALCVTFLTLITFKWPLPRVLSENNTSQNGLKTGHSR